MTSVDDRFREIIVPDDEDIEDESDLDESVVPVGYDITSFGIDFDIEGICRRLRRDEIYIPPFQRSFIWTLRESSSFIESLLLGLPVPGVFLAQEADSGKLLVIDGQQRLKSLLYFYDGVFNPRPEDRTQRVFRLTKTDGKFEGLTYETLEEKDRINLDNSVIHATVVRQEAPPDDDTSIYHIFQRLNKGGRRLYPQEMRCALYHGELIDTVQSLNNHPNWRQIFGRPSARLKDQELILRFLALYFSHQNYTRPIFEFLNKFANRNKNPGQKFLNESREIFIQTVDLFWDALGQKAFRPVRALNAAVFDSMAIGLARKIKASGVPSRDQIKLAYEALLLDGDYLATVTSGTSDEASVATRLEKATSQFSGV
jgi:hypothetical protein